MEKKEDKKLEKEKECTDLKCPFHGSLRVRGRYFKGIVKKIVGKRAVVELERLSYSKKYERYAKKKTRLYAYIPKCLAPRIAAGSSVEIGECRPLSKIVHFVVVEVEKK